VAHEQVVALVDRPGVAVLERHHPVGNGADLDGLEHPVDRMEGHGRGAGEEPLDGALAIGPGLALEADGDRALGHFDGDRGLLGGGKSGHRSEISMRPPLSGAVWSRDALRPKILGDDNRSALPHTLRPPALQHLGP